MTLRCMQALVRVQARVMAQYVNISSEQNIPDHLQNCLIPLSRQRYYNGRLIQFLISIFCFLFFDFVLSIGNFQEGWCDMRGTVEQVRTKLQMRQEGAIKRERAISHSIFQKV